MEFEAVKKVIAEKMDVDPSKITMESSLQDMQIDSLDMVEIVMAIEEELNISLEDLTDAKTVGDVVNFIQSKK